MKKRIIKLTEQDISNMVMESFIAYENKMRQLREYDRDEWDEDDYDFADQPEFEDAIVWFNPETKECCTDGADATPGIWAECTVSVDDYHMENNGIGSYEYWGQTGYDKGTDYAEIDSVSVEVNGWYQITDDDMDVLENDAPTLDAKDQEIIGDYAMDNNLFEY